MKKKKVIAKGYRYPDGGKILDKRNGQILGGDLQQIDVNATGNTGRPQASQNMMSVDRNFQPIMGEQPLEFSQLNFNGPVEEVDEQQQPKAPRQGPQFQNPLAGRGFALGDVIGGGLAFANALLPDMNTRSDARKFQPLAYNANSMGTGSTALYEDGGRIAQNGTEMQPISPEERDLWEQAQSVAYQQD